MKFKGELIILTFLIPPSDEGYILNSAKYFSLKYIFRINLVYIRLKHFGVDATFLLLICLILVKLIKYLEARVTWEFSHIDVLYNNILFFTNLALFVIIIIIIYYKFLMFIIFLFLLGLFFKSLYTQFFFLYVCVHENQKLANGLNISF